jgi:predicted AlkP superfamily pyrophosphatase or phosphodiesterase
MMVSSKTTVLSIAAVVVALVVGLVCLCGIHHDKTAYAPSAAASAATRQTTAATNASSVKRPNLLFIMCDQLRFDTLGLVQSRMSEYQGKLQIRTPNLDTLAAQGVYFEQAYCQSPLCAPSRGTLRTGCTLERHGVEGNDIADGGKAATELIALFASKYLSVQTCK